MIRCICRDEPLFFGTSRANRYDAAEGEYGVLYLGRDLPTALMESVFHKHQWHLSHQRSITLTEVRSRLVRVVGLLQPLLLADLTAEGVMAAHLGLNLAQLASRDYVHTQRASLAIHRTTDNAGQPHFDGVLYVGKGIS